MKPTPIQFQDRESDESRTAKLKRLAQQVAALSIVPQATTVASGTVWYTGSGPPSDGLGSAGDFYLDVTTGDVYELT